MTCESDVTVLQNYVIVQSFVTNWQDVTCHNQVKYTIGLDHHSTVLFVSKALVFILKICPRTKGAVLFGT